MTSNTKDARGHSLFAGFKNEETAFVKNANGKVKYTGDRIHTVQISENMSVPTSLDGLTVFGRVKTANGMNIFEIIDGVAASINPLRELMNTQLR